MKIRSFQHCSQQGSKNGAPWQFPFSDPNFGYECCYLQGIPSITPCAAAPVRCRLGFRFTIIIPACFAPPANKEQVILINYHQFYPVHSHWLQCWNLVGFNQDQNHQIEISRIPSENPPCFWVVRNKVVLTRSTRILKRSETRGPGFLQRGAGPPGY